MWSLTLRIFAYSVIYYPYLDNGVILLWIVINPLHHPWISKDWTSIDLQWNWYNVFFPLLFNCCTSQQTYSFYSQIERILLGALSLFVIGGRLGFIYWYIAQLHTSKYGLYLIEAQHKMIRLELTCHSALHHLAIMVKSKTEWKIWIWKYFLKKKYTYLCLYFTKGHSLSFGEINMEKVVVCRYIYMNISARSCCLPVALSNNILLLVPDYSNNKNECPPKRPWVYVRPNDLPYITKCLN